MFTGRWFTLPVGHGSIEVKRIVSIEGKQAYDIEAEGSTNDLLSTFYPIHDTLVSYLDVETLHPLRSEKRQREGKYHADEVVTFDYERMVATYHSNLNGSTKEVPLEPDAYDLLGALYQFRNQPQIQAEKGQASTQEMRIYTDEKIYHMTIRVSPLQQLELLKRGTFPCIMVEPFAAFKGVLVKRGRIWAYLSGGASQLPLLVRMTTPWGPMSAVLDRKSIFSNPLFLQGRFQVPNATGK